MVILEMAGIAERRSVQGKSEGIFLEKTEFDGKVYSTIFTPHKKKVIYGRKLSFKRGLGGLVILRMAGW